MRQASNEDWRRQLTSRKVKDYSINQPGKRNHASIVRPNSVDVLKSIMHPESGRPTPLRPMGAGSASTACTLAAGGTVVDMTALDDLVGITDATVTVQAGMSLRKLADALSEHDMELAGSLDLIGRTVGGAIASACIGPSTASDGAYFAAQVIAIKVITPTGESIVVDNSRGQLLNVFRLSYGLLGIIYEATLRIRPAQIFVRKQQKMSIKTFARAAPRLAGADVGLKFYLMPFKNQIFAELRRFDDKPRAVHSLPWKLKDWGESTVLPSLCGKLSNIVPVASLRYRLIDEVNGVGQSIFNNPFVAGGSGAVEQRIQTTGTHPLPPLNYSTWCFPAADLTMVLYGYQDFCQRYYKTNRYRCDMPTVGFKLDIDRSALLSPSFDEPMFALRAVSTPNEHWEDFCMELADFAEEWGAMPLFNQSRCMEMRYASLALGSRLEFFRKVRQRMDPNNRMLNPFLAQYFC